MAEQQNEPTTISTATTGSHATGNYPLEPAEHEAAELDQPTEGMIWIERKDQAKQAMARKGDMRSAQAAPDHPHLAERSRSGGRQ